MLFTKHMGLFTCLALGAFAASKTDSPIDYHSRLMKGYEKQAKIHMDKAKGSSKNSALRHHCFHDNKRIAHQYRMRALNEKNPELTKFADDHDQKAKACKDSYQDMSERPGKDTFDYNQP